MSKQKDQTHPSVQELKIKCSLLQMTPPYYQNSLLWNSPFSGYYTLFFIYSLYFIFVYPVLNYLRENKLFDLAVLKITNTNIKWDFISLSIFLFLASIFISIGNPSKRSIKIMIPTYILLFVGIGYGIVDQFQMFFTDRIFIVVFSWAFCVKTISYELDNHKNLNSDTFKDKIKYLFSPIVIYSHFKKQHDPHLPIHKIYLLKKFIISGLCIFASNIIIIEFVDPILENKQNSSFVELFFKLIPYLFYMNMILYYMVFENILNAFAEITQIKDRRVYLDWWNSETIGQFLQRWCIFPNEFLKYYCPQLQRKVNNSIITAVLLIMLLEVFGRGINIQSIILFTTLVFGMYIFSQVKWVQNNYVVHLMCITFTPLLVAIQQKYKIFV